MFLYLSDIANSTDKPRPHTCGVPACRSGTPEPQVVATTGTDFTSASDPIAKVRLRK